MSGDREISNQKQVEQCFYESGWSADEMRFFNRESKAYLIRSIMTFFSTNATDGHYFEFGCYGGYTMRIAYDHTKVMRPAMRYYGFDSFEGFPELTDLDEGHWKKGDLAMSEPEFRRICTDHGMPDERLITIQGAYGETLCAETASKLNGVKAAIVYIDVDVYSSACSVLEFIHPMFVRGTIVVFDDWNCFYADDRLGERKAWKDFTDRHPDMRFSPFVSTHMARSFVYLGAE